MSESLKLSLVRDSATEVNQTMDVAVYRGAQEINPVHVQQDSMSTSQISFNYTVPSLDTITNRRMYIKATHVIKATRKNCPAGAAVFDWGNNCSLAPYGWAQGISTIQVGLNNNMTTTDFTSSFDELMRLYDSRTKKDVHSTAPNALDDFYCDYADGVDTANNSLGSWENSDRFQVPRGAFNVEIGSGLNADNSIQNAGVVPSNPGGAAADIDVYIKYTQTIPLFVSPLAFSDSLNNSGVNGLNKLAVQVNLGNGAGNSRLLRTSLKPAVGELVVSSAAFTEAALLLVSYTSYPDSRVAPECILPYYNVDTKIFSGFSPITSADSTGTLSSQSITLNQIPDLIIITAGRQKNALKSYDSDSYYTIESLNINMCERSGLLAAANSEDLFKFSKEGGYPLGWNQWSGKVMKNGSVVPIGSIGSMMCLVPGKHISLPANLAPGSVFNFQFQVSNIKVKANYSAAQWTAKANSEVPELRVIFVSSGSFSIANGSAVQQVGLLGSSDVAKVLTETNVEYSDDVNRAYGGAEPAAMVNKLASDFKTMAPHATMKYKKMGSGMLGGARLGGKRHSKL